VMFLRHQAQVRTGQVLGTGQAALPERPFGARPLGTVSRGRVVVGEQRLERPSPAFVGD
jgi:hypothetical protein